jgi:hypothetical protein
MSTIGIACVASQKLAKEIVRIIRCIFLDKTKGTRVGRTNV